jgi:hypothetical protein
LTPFAICLCGDYDLGYKRLTWGMHVDQAKELIDGFPDKYKEPLIGNLFEILSYIHKADGVNFNDTYSFENGKFYSVYWTLEEGVSSELAKAYYSEFVKRMNSQYGKGREERWTSGSTEVDLTSGYMAWWETKKLRIQIRCEGVFDNETFGDFCHDVSIMITNKQLENEYKKAGRMEKQKKDQENSDRVKKLF